MRIRDVSKNRIRKYLDQEPQPEPSTVTGQDFVMTESEEPRKSIPSRWATMPLWERVAAGIIFVPMAPVVLLTMFLVLIIACVCALITVSIMVPIVVAKAMWGAGDKNESDQSVRG